jgi:hypothetical protein
MPRIRIALTLAAITSLVVVSGALAAKVTGGTTTITPSAAAATVLSNNHITLTPIAAASASSTGALTFPITAGRLNTKTLHGRLFASGGLQLSNGTKTVTVRHLTIVSTKRGASIWGLVRGHSKRLCTGLRRHALKAVCYVVTRYRFARIAKITSGTVSGGTFAGNLAITRVTANAINQLAGSKVVSAGAPLGTISITPTLA